MNSEDPDDDAQFAESVVVLEITDTLDLHSFPPRDMPVIIAEYLDLCRERGLLNVRLIHGRGRGVQRAVVIRLLTQRDDVLEFGDAPPQSGGWGSTLVRLKPRV
ncbi:MAG: Smr/MutS family protein [Vicinamibacteria bacterium]|jgi:DNA-nicking Smr family endonuclease|nr:Smr/MutS family protein [Vicinamibacteria bacterium]